MPDVSRTGAVALFNQGPRVGRSSAGFGRSYHVYEFVERGRHPEVLTSGVDAEFVVAPSEVPCLSG